MALPIVGEFWKQIRADGKLKNDRHRFEMEDTIRTFFNCPLRIPYHPDSLAVLMQDSSIRDSIMKNGFRVFQIWWNKGLGVKAMSWEEFIDENGEILEGLPEDPNQPAEEKNRMTKKKSRTRLHYLPVIRKRWRLKKQFLKSGDGGW